MRDRSQAGFSACPVVVEPLPVQVVEPVSGSRLFLKAKHLVLQSSSSCLNQEIKVKQK